MSKIEWTEQTWNPIVGCSIVSPGCTNCYAMKMAGRLEAMSLATGARILDGESRDEPLNHYLGTTQPSKAGRVWTGKVALAPDRILTEPLRRKKPTTYFVNSMGDLFHEDVPDEWIDRVFAVMALCPQNTFQVLTKRSARMRSYCTAAAEAGSDLATDIASTAMEFGLVHKINVRTSFRVPLPNVWLGVSAERQQEADERIPDLLATPAAVRFVSAEPLLGAIDFTRRIAHTNGDRLSTRTWLHELNWIIVGGESGPGARPMHPDWARSIRDQCQAAGVPFFFKQWGEWAPETLQVERGGVLSDFDGSDLKRIGKARAGRLLDGREWSEMPGASKYDQAQTDPHHGGKVAS